MSEKNCRNCKWSGMDMDMDPYCIHPNVAKEHPYGLVLHNPKIGKFCEREKLPLWEPREGP